PAPHHDPGSRGRRLPNRQGRLLTAEAAAPLAEALDPAVGVVVARPGGDGWWATERSPLFEAACQPCSYGFRPNRRAQDAIAELHLLATNHYEWVVEGDITACSTRSTPPRRHRRRRALAPTAWS